jgi:hypothetical protein
MDTLSDHYTLKAGSARPPKEYLGSDISQFDIPPTEDMSAPVRCWSMAANTYIKRAVAEVKRVLADVDQ